MSTRLLMLVWVCCSAAVAEPQPPRAIQVVEAPPDKPRLGPEWVVSNSVQFRVTGGQAFERGNVALLADEAKNELLRLTEEKDAWKIPVSIHLAGKPGDPLPARTIAMRRLLVEGASQLRVDFHLARGLEQETERFKRAITAILLYERTIQRSPADEGDAALTVPPWLADGLREASDWRLNRSDRKLYEALFKRRGLFKIEDLMAVSDGGYEEMDSAMRAAFRVSSGSLVMALLEQPQGREGFRAFLNEVAGFEGEMPALLRKHFPELNLSETSLAKWLELQLANKGALNLLTDVLSVTQTEASLADALHFSVRDTEGISRRMEISAWPEISALKEPERAAAVLPARDALARLSFRSFPSYRPMLAEYQLILNDIAANKTNDIATRLADLDERRKTMLTRSTRASDYLDWFEITTARETSGVFDDYLRLKERLKSNPHQRKDHISEYLDRMEKTFHREQPRNPSGLPQ
jgi:hypothetical protein